MAAIDKRNRLNDEVFTYTTNKDQTRVTIYWYEQQATILRGRSAEKFLQKIAFLQGKDAQLLMAKVTGNFKRGNERVYGPESNKRK